MTEARSILIPVLIGTVSFLLNLILPAVILCGSGNAVGGLSDYGCWYIDVLLRILGV